MIGKLRKGDLNIFKICLMQKKRFHFLFGVTEAQDKTGKDHPAMYILQQTCHFRHLSKCFWNMESYPTGLLFGIAH